MHPHYWLLRKFNIKYKPLRYGQQPLDWHSAVKLSARFQFSGLGKACAGCQLRAFKSEQLFWRGFIRLDLSPETPM